jgi:hypothetical protein
MGVDQGQRARFLLQGPHKGDQKAVLNDIGAVASMEGMAIIHCDSNPGDRPLTVLLGTVAEPEAIEVTIRC